MTKVNVSVEGISRLTKYAAELEEQNTALQAHNTKLVEEKRELEANLEEAHRIMECMAESVNKADRTADTQAKLIRGLDKRIAELEKQFSITKRREGKLADQVDELEADLAKFGGHTDDCRHENEGYPLNANIKRPGRCIKDCGYAEIEKDKEV